MANSSIVGLLKVLLTADTAQFSAEMKRVSSSAQAWQKDLASVGRQATALGSSLTKTLTLPIVGLGVASLKAAIDFESSFAGVRKTVDATESEFAALAQEFRDLSKQIPINVNDLNRLGEAAGALGIPKAAIADFSRVMALLGVTTNVTADQAAESIAKIQNIFGAAGKDTERFASTLVQLGNVGASTEQEILALATRIASAGNTIGLSQGQVLGFSAAIANVGMEAEAGGSAMSRVFVDIASAVSKGGVAVAGFAEVAGMSAAQFTKAFKEDAAGATLAFVQGLGRIKDGGGDLIGVLNALGFTELRQADLLRRLAGDSDGLKKSLDTQNSAWRENTALSEEARKRFETTASQLKLLWNQIQDVAITLGNALLPTIQSLVALTGRLLPLVDSLAKGFAALPSPLQLGVFALGAMVAVTGPLIFLFGQLMLSASALAGAFAANGIATRALAVAQGTLAGTSSALTIAMGLLWKAIAGVGVAFAGWHVGKWIGETSGLTDFVERATGTMMGLTVAQIEAGIAARKQAAAHQEQQSSISDTGKAAAEAAAITAALTKAQKDGEASAKAAAGASADLATRLAKQAEVAKKAAQAAKELKERQDRLFGRDLISRAEHMISDLGGIANISKLLPDMQATMLKGVDEAIAAYRQLGQAVPASLSGVRDVLVPLVAANTLAANVETNINAILYRLGQLGMKVGLLFPSLRTTAFDPGMITGATSVTLKAPKLMSMFGADLKNAVTQFSRLLGPTILQALTGGGSVSQSIGGLAGMQIGNSLSATFGGVVKKNLGEKIGGAFASFLPGIGALIGPLIGKGLAKLGSLLGFGPSELDKVREARGEWLKAQGGLEKLHKTLGAVAGDAKVRAAWAELFNAKNVKDYEAALARFNTTVSEAQTTLNARLADEQDAREFLQATVEKYGFTIDQLGQKWKKQALADQAELLIREYTALTASGIDHNLVIERMGANLQEFLQTAIRTGAEVPEQMRPLLRQLIETGSLIDENGNAFSLGALDAVNWSKTLTENIQLVVNKLDELIRTITERLGKAIEEIPPLEIPLSPRDTFLTRNRGGNKFPALASGGIVMQPTLAMLGESGPEAVVPLRAGGGGFGSQTIILEVDGMVMARASVPYIPGELRRLRLA